VIRLEGTISQTSGMSPVGAVSVVRVPLVAANDLTKDRPNSRSKLTFRVLERESEVTYCFRRAGDKHPVISEVVGRRLSRRTCTASATLSPPAAPPAVQVIFDTKSQDLGIIE
jgi:hypothetical protein